MFKAQPGQYALPFTLGIFGTSILFFLLRLRGAVANLPIAGWLIVLGAQSMTALLAGAVFWLGLGYSHREPVVRGDIGRGAFSYLMANNILLVFGHSTGVQWLSLGVLFALSFLLGKRRLNAPSLDDLHKAKRDEPDIQGWTSQLFVDRSNI